MLTPLEQDVQDFYNGDDSKARDILNRLEARKDDQYSADTLEASAAVTRLVLSKNPQIQKFKGLNLEEEFEKLKGDLRVV